MKTILVPVDFSERTDEVVRFASSWAKAMGASLQILHAVEMPEYVPADLAIRMSTTSQPVTVKEALLREGEEKMERALMRWSLGEVNSTVVFDNAVDAILTAAESADLVVVAPHGKGTLDRLLLGSVTERVVARCRTPVLVARSVELGAAFTRKIMVPVDLSEGSLAALRMAQRIQAYFGATVEVLHVVTTPPMAAVGDAWMVEVGASGASFREWALTSAREAMVSFLQKHGIEGMPLQLEYGLPEKTIVEKVKDGQYDLVVMGTHGRRGLSRLIFGSVAAKTLREAPCPVMTTHAES